MQLILGHHVQISTRADSGNCCAYWQLVKGKMYNFFHQKQAFYIDSPSPLVPWDLFC